MAEIETNQQKLVAYLIHLDAELRIETFNAFFRILTIALSDFFFIFTFDL